MTEHAESEQLVDAGPVIMALADLDPFVLGRSVAVAVDDSAQALAAAQWAARAAQARRLDLVLVHGRPIEGAPSPSDEVVYEVAAQLRLPPRMRIVLVVDDEEVERLMERVSRTAPLVVIGQDRMHSVDLDIGRAAAQLARRSSCPSVIVPAVHRRARTNQQTMVAAVGWPGRRTSAVLDAAFTEADRYDLALVVLHVTRSARSDADLSAEQRSWVEYEAG